MLHRAVLIACLVVWGHVGTASAQELGEIFGRVTDATGGVMVGVRVGRRVRVACGFWVGVMLGERLAVVVGLVDDEMKLGSAVEVGLWSNAVGLGPLSVITFSGVGEGETVCVSSRRTTGEGVTRAASPAWPVRAMMVGI